MVLRIFRIIATSGFLTASECTEFVFGPGSAPDPTGGAYSAPTDPIADLRGPTSEGDKRGGKEERHRRVGEEGAEGLTPFCKFLDPPLGTKNVCILTTGGAYARYAPPCLSIRRCITQKFKPQKPLLSHEVDRGGLALKTGPG